MKWSANQSEMHSAFDFDPFVFEDFENLFTQCNRVLKDRPNILTGKLPDEKLIFQRCELFILYRVV